MSTKNKLLLHVDHLYSQRYSEVELAKKLESLLVMIEWAKKQGDISEEECQEVITYINTKKNPKTVPAVSTPKKKSWDISRRSRIIILILIVSLTAIPIALLSQSKKKITLANPSDVKKEGRALRFQGKLIDSNGLPIDHKVDVSFSLYSQKNDGKPVYTGNCTGENGIVPRIDGSFQVSVGTDCQMKRISDSVFTKGQGLFLGIQVGTDKELSPRYPIATVQYASNTDKVKGLTLGTNESSIPYIDEEGRLILGAVSPKLKSTRGDFSIEGQTVSLKTNEDSAGTITLDPAEGGNVIVAKGNVGIGTTEPQYKLDVQGVVGFSADILLNGDNTSIYQNKGGSIRFYTTKEVDDLTNPVLLLASENKVGIATNKIVDTISAGGSLSPVENGKFNLGSATNKWKTIYTNELVMADQGIAAFWQRKGSTISTAKNGDDLLLGSQTEQNALIKMSGKEKTASWINSGLLGVGTSTPHQLFTALGSSDNNSISSITNLTKYDTNGTNVLRLGLGTSTSGIASRFLDFYAGATSDTSGTRVGSIRLQNGGVVYQTSGADFAEYVDLEEPAEQGDIISITSTGNTRAGTDGVIMGVVTDVAGFVGNASDSKVYKNKTLVGLVGQVKTNVSTANGLIKTGDQITTSDFPGVGAKAIESGYVVGTVISTNDEIHKAMTSANCSNKSQDKTILCGKVKVLVSPHYYALKNIAQFKDAAKGTAEIPAGHNSFTIYNNRITKDSTILLTSISSTPVIISLSEQKTCEGSESKPCKAYFSVVTNKETSTSLKFNWLIVN